MGKKKICPKCGKEIKDSKKQRLERSMSMKSLKMIKVAGIKELEEKTKGCCFECWKIEARHVMKPFAEALGQSAKDW